MFHKQKLNVFGMRQEPRIDGVLEWSRPVEGEIVFETGVTKFNDWSISNKEITNAVLNSEKYFFKHTQSLAIESESGKYMFALAEPADNTYKFPFPVTFTNSVSPIGKLFRIVAIFGLVYIAYYVLLGGYLLLKLI
jgi:hypothetical protein